MRLIIAEDNKTEQKNITNIISGSGLDINICAVFSNGRDAFDYICDNECDIIISDIQMPHFDGLSLLKAINEKNLQTKVIFVSCHDNPEYLINAIENNAASYILKPIKREAFLKTLKKVYASVEENKNFRKQLEAAEKLKKYAKEKQIRDLMLDSPCDKASIYEEFSNLKYLVVAVIGIEDYNPYFDLQSDGMYEISMITKYLSELRYENIELYPTIINSQAIAVTVISDIKSIPTDEIFSECYNYILSNFGICIKTGISNNDTDISNLSMLYRQASDALLYGDLENEKTVITYTNITSQTEFPIKLIEIVNEVEKLLLNPDEKKVTEFIDRYLELPNLSSTYIQKFSYSFVHSIELNINKYGKSIENLTGIEIWQKLSTYNSESNIKKLLYNIFFAAFELLNENTTENNNKVVEMVKSIIHEHYADKITTEYLSKKINYSQRYLSLIFKNETGKTILQYLTEFRIEKAKELLMEKDSKIYHVAAAVGYTRNSHFNNIFKKYVGVSPYDYKAKYTE